MAKRVARKSLSKSTSSLKKKQKKVLKKKRASNWPTERNVLFRPDRLPYLTGKAKSDQCVFCLAASEKPSFESLVVYHSLHSMVVMNKFPYNNCHVLVMPKRHIADILDLTQTEYDDLNSLVRSTLRALRKSVNPQGVNLGVNLGAPAGAGIPGHLHYHLVPRWSGDLNFFPLIAGVKIISMSMQDSYQIIRQALERVLGER